MTDERKDQTTKNQGKVFQINEDPQKKSDDAVKNSTSVNAEGGGKALKINGPARKG